MLSRRLAVLLAIGVAVCFGSVVLYVLSDRKSRREKDEDEADELEAHEYPFLSEVHCIEFIRNSKVMFIMRGLPGSGKSTVARQIKRVYSDLSLICSADDFRLTDQREYVWKSEEYGTTHLMCEEKAKQACQNGLPVIIIDNTNIKKRFLYWYIDMARSNGYYIVLVEPKTSWKYDISDLALRNHHTVSEEILRGMLSEFEQIIAKYYGWFLSRNSARTLQDSMFEVLNGCFETIPSFRDDLKVGNNSWEGKQGYAASSQTSSENTLSSLTSLEHIQDLLHVTAFYNRRGEALQAYNYVSSPVVQDALGSVITLTIIAWTITPRTVTARVKLNSQQIELWNNYDSLAFQEGSLASSSQSSDSPLKHLAYNDLQLRPNIGKGDTAHATLSRRNDVTPVQGRYDLRDLIKLEVGNNGYEQYQLSQGIARRFSDELWAVYLNEPVHVDALFTGYY